MLDYFVEGIDENESSDIQRRMSVSPSMTRAYTKMNDIFSPLKHLKDIDQAVNCAPAGLANKTFQKIFLLEQERKSQRTPSRESSSDSSKLNTAAFSPRARVDNSPSRGRQSDRFLTRPSSIVACICAGFLLILLPAIYYNPTGFNGANLVKSPDNKNTKLVGATNVPRTSKYTQAGFGPNIPIDSRGLNGGAQGNCNSASFASTQSGLQNINPEVAAAKHFMIVQNQTPYAFVDNSRNSGRFSGSSASSGVSYYSTPENGRLIDLTSSSPVIPAKTQFPEKVFCAKGPTVLVPDSEQAVVIDPRVGQSTDLNEFLPSFEQTIPEQHDNFICPEKGGATRSNSSSDPNWDPERAWNEGVPPVN